MCRFNFLSTGISSAFSLLLFLSTCLPLSADTTEKEKGLFYYVVDRSGSITTYGLTEPIRKAITEHAAQLPEETEVRLVFFSRRASESMRWERMTAEAKADFASSFSKNFIPDGPTRLYDTMGEVMNEIRASSDNYRFVSVLVFSDGENNWTRQYRSWKQLEPVYRDLVRRHEHSFIYWITLEFDPAESPPAWVQHEPQAPGTKQIPIPEPAPQAEFAAHPRQLKVGEDVYFEYVAKGGRVTEFAWDFGDGKTASEPNPVHRYEQDGSYTVILRTTGPGGQAEEIKSSLIEVAPVIALAANFRFSPERIQVGDRLELQDVSVGNPVTREWSLNGKVFSDEIAPSVMIEEPGEITVSLTVRRKNETDVASQTFEVLPPAPPADFAIVPAEANFGDNVVFSAEQTEAGWEHTWTIDGEITLQGAEVEWTSDRDGLMHVVHTVEGPGGLSRGSDRIFIHAAVEFVPSTAFTVEPKFFKEGDTVVLRARETGEGWSHEWLVGGKQLGQGPEFHWETDQTGNLLITHRVRVPDSEAVFEESDEVLGRPHELVRVAFSLSRTSGVYPFEVKFEDKSEGEAVAYLWDFGDGNVSRERNPVHTYEEPGEYAVTLSVTNPQGQVTSNVDSTILSVGEPMPFWQKAAIGLVAALLLWVLVIVPLILRPMLAPQKGPKLVGIKTYSLYLPGRRGWLRFLWPRNSLTLGSAANSDIRLPNVGAVRKSVAIIERAPGASTYSIRPIKKNEIFRIEQQTGLMQTGGEAKAKITGARMMKDGDTFEIGGERLTWCQPKKASAKKLQKKKQIQKKKAFPKGRQSLVKVRN